MGSSHGKLTIITVATKDISLWTKTSTFTRGASEHDITGYGVDDVVVSGGLKNGKFSCGGWYDNTASTGTKAVLDPLVGTVVALVRKVEGTGTGKPSEAFSGLLTSYVETSPHNDIVSWSAEFTCSGPVTKTAQV